MQSAIGLVKPKTNTNIAQVLRAASCFDCRLVLIEGARYKVDSPDTTKFHRHYPVLKVEDIKTSIPTSFVPIAVDLIPDAEPLQDFVHPANALYIFGPEDGTLGKVHTSWCKTTIYIPSRFCLNLAMAVNVVLYDRFVKEIKSGKRNIIDSESKMNQRHAIAEKACILQSSTL